MATRFAFNRQELAGALGDLGVMLPLALALIQFNGLDATALFLAVGLFYVGAGLYYRIPTPIQPMKAIAAYAIAQSLSPLQISTAGFLSGLILIVLGLTRAVDLLARVVPKSVIRGVQLTTGVLLLTKGLHFVLGDSPFQQEAGRVEPALSLQALGPVPISIIIGAVAFVAALALLKNKLAPAGLVVVIGGTIVGLALGGWQSLADFRPGLHLPALMPYGMPDLSLTIIALTMLVAPQLPMTVGNAILAEADLTREYFDKEQAKRVTPRALSLSMGIGNVLGALIGGMPMCHGAGGLAAHYRFGARTGGMNLMLGGLFVVVALLLGDHATALLSIIPLSLLGALLVFAGAQLAIVIVDINDRTDLFVALLCFGVALATNLAIGFAVSLTLAYILRKLRVEV